MDHKLWSIALPLILLFFNQFPKDGPQIVLHGFMIDIISYQIHKLGS